MKVTNSEHVIKTKTLSKKIICKDSQGDDIAITVSRFMSLQDHEDSLSIKIGYGNGTTKMITLDADDFCGDHHIDTARAIAKSILDLCDQKKVL